MKFHNDIFVYIAMTYCLCCNIIKHKSILYCRSIYELTTLFNSIQFCDNYTKNVEMIVNQKKFIMITNENIRQPLRNHTRFRKALFILKKRNFSFVSTDFRKHLMYDKTNFINNVFSNDISCYVSRVYVQEIYFIDKINK